MPNIASMKVSQTEPAEFVAQFIPRDVQVRQIQEIEWASLGNIFAPPPPPTAYVHTQSSPSVEWVINHNLGARPIIEVRTVGGVVMEADVVHLTLNQSRVYLASAVAGEARCM